MRRPPIPIQTSEPRPKTVHLYGDSIFKGWGFGEYDYPSPLNRIGDIAAILAADNGADIAFNRTTVQDPYHVLEGIVTGTIQPGDRIVYEDAGPRESTAAAIGERLRRFAFAAAFRREPSMTVLTTMFDYNPMADATHDEPLADGSGVHANFVTWYVAQEMGCGFIDWNKAMDDAREVLEPQGVPVVHPDGIHPTPWGNVLLAASLVRYEGVAVANVGRVVDAFVAEQQTLESRGLAPTFSRGDADGWVRFLVGDAAN